MDIVSVLKDYLRFPGISADPNAKQHISDSANYLAALLEKAGTQSEIVPTAEILLSSGATTPSVKISRTS